MTRKNVPLESSIKEAVLKYLKKIPGCHAEKTHGGYYGTRGKPDITGCINGRRFEIELKRPGEEPTPNQIKQMGLWRAAGAVVGVACSVDDVKKILTEGGLL